MDSDNGKSWKGGFIYTADSTDSRQLQKMYFFDVSAGERLWIAEVYNVTN
jgi:hypothetical protein